MDQHLIENKFRLISNTCLVFSATTKKWLQSKSVKHLLHTLFDSRGIGTCYINRKNCSKYSTKCTGIGG